MNAFVVAIFCLVASTSAGHLGYGGHAGYYAPNPAAHIPSGSVNVDHDGAVVAGPAGSVRTDNGLHGHGAGSIVDGPAGQIATRGGHTTLTGPGNGHDDGSYYDGAGAGAGAGAGGAFYAAAPVYAAAPAVYSAPAVYAGPAVGHAIPGVGAWGPAAGFIGGWGHGHGHGHAALLGHGHGW